MAAVTFRSNLTPPWLTTPFESRHWEAAEEQPDGIQIASNPGYTWEPAWKPQWIVKNVMEEISSTSTFVLEVTDDGRPNRVHAEIKHLVRIYNAMDLRKFPYDEQAFTIDIEIEGQDTGAVRFVDFGNDVLVADALYNRCVFQDMMLISDEGRRFEWEFYETDRAVSRRKMALSGLHIALIFKRNASYYNWNVSSIMFLISSCVLTGWAIEVHSTSDRLGVDFTLLLTAVAFKLVIASLLPPIDYLTILDKYVMLCLFFISVATVAHALVPAIFAEEAAVDADVVVFYAMAGFWLFVNLLYLLMCCGMCFTPNPTGSQPKMVETKKSMNAWK